MIEAEAEMLPFAAASCAALAETLTLTVPSAVGVTISEYVSPSITVKSPLVPFVTETSLASKPLTILLNWNVNVIGLAFVVVFRGVIASVGAVSFTSVTVT